MNSAPTRATSQRSRILALLRSAGNAGMTNLTLNSVCLRYGARIFELRRLGYCIETEAVGDGVFKFVLRGEVVMAEAQPARERKVPAAEQAALF